MKRLFIISTLMITACAQPSDKMQLASTEKRALAAKVEAKARDDLGPKWVPTALKIVKVESNFRCDAIGPMTRHGHAFGLGQMLFASAQRLGYQGSARGLLDCDTNLKYTIAHMADCERRGADTQDKMAFCHVGGVPWAVSRYSFAYRDMVRAAPIIVARQ